MADSAVDAPTKRDLLMLLVVCPVLIAGCLGAPFLNYDDDAHVESPYATGALPWSAAFDQAYGSIFPLTMISFRIENAVYRQTFGIQNWAPPARVANLVLHAIAAVCVWLLLGALSFGRGMRLFVTGAFLLHPMACESVCWISERKNGLVAAFGFGALAVAIGYRGRFRALLIGLLYTAALLSKPSALGLLPVLLVCEGWNFWRNKAQPDPKPPAAIASTVALMIFLISAGIAAGKFAIHSHNLMMMQPPGGSAFTALLTDAEIMRRYMQSLVLPIDLSFAYAVSPIVSAADPRFAANALAVIAMVAGSTLLSQRRELSLFFWFWFFAALGPNSNVVATACLMQDRYVYLSMPAFFAALALGVEGLASRISGKKIEQLNLSRAGMLALWGVLLALATGSLVRSQLFADDYTLFNDAVAKQPSSALANITFGITLINMADHLEALPTPKNSPDQVEEFRKRAVYHLQRTSELEDRERLISPGHYFAALGYVQYKRKHYDEAEAAARKVLEEQFRATAIPPVKIEANQVLGEIALKRNNFDEAFNFAKRGSEVANINSLDVPEMWMLAGEALEGLHRNADAIAEYSRIARGMPGFEKAHERIQALQAH